MKQIAVLIAVAGVAAIATAQPYPVEAQLRFEVWDGSAWTSSVTVNPGATVQYRAVVDYTGPRTDLFGLGEILYQPTFSNADNSGPNLDTLGAYRNGGVTGVSVSGSMLTAAEGTNGGDLGTYGRVVYGQAGTNATQNNIITTFRHGGDSPINNAPAGTWLRIAGSFVNSWPAFPLTQVGGPGSSAINNIQKGIASGQSSQALAPSTHVQGVDDLVIWRGSFTASTDPIMGMGRTVSINSDVAFLKRAGGTTSTDDRRFMTWQTGSGDNGSYRTMVDFVPGTINIVPAPGALALLGLGGLVAARRRRA
jgi:hypothetical protein